MLYNREFAAAVAIAKENAWPVTLPRALAELYYRDPTLLPSLIADADDDAWWAWDTLSLIAQDVLSTGDLLPPVLAAWLARVLETRCCNRPPQPRGPDPFRNLARNGQILWAAVRLSGLGYAPITRPGGGPCSESGGSVCDAVGVAFGGGLAYKSVEALWSTLARCESGKATPADRRSILYPYPLYPKQLPESLGLITGRRG